MPFKANAVTVDLTGHSGVLREPLIYNGKRQVFVVPAGFVTDFASVPWWSQWLTPRLGRWTLSAVLHDWLCTDGIRDGVVDSVDADGIFRRTMREAGVDPIRQWLMWTAVRWAALVNPLRRPGWLRTAPGVLGISAAVLAPIGYLGCKLFT